VSPGAAIQTLIVEDNPPVRQALADLVSEDPGLEVAGLGPPPETPTRSWKCSARAPWATW
jgi:hypothetical protein